MEAAEGLSGLAAMPLINLIVFISGIIIAILITTRFLKNKTIKIGKAEISDSIKKETRVSEREIIKKQIHIARAVCLNFKNLVPHAEKYNLEIVENICYKVADEIEDMILFNHLSTEDEYIDTRFPLVWSVVTKNLNENYTKEDRAELETLCKENFKKLIKILLEIRKERE